VAALDTAPLIVDEYAGMLAKWIKAVQMLSQPDR
jgi:hypothetical protein